jgi:hypothetical protein
MWISLPDVLAITSVREGARMGSVANCFSASQRSPEDSHLPLRELLARNLVKIAGGPFSADQSNAGKGMVRNGVPDC